MPSDTARRAIHDFLVAHRDAQTRFLVELVKVPSDNPPGDCGPHAARAAELLEGIGFKVERHAVPESVLRAHGMQSCTNLVIRERFGTGGPTVACNAHGDVVAPGLGWTHAPYGAEIVDGRMFGRGVAVSKSDFATYAYALAALKAAVAAGVTNPTGTVELHFTYDEESGGELGPKWLIDQGVTRPHFAISAGFSYGIVTAHNGCLHLEVEVVGKSGHAAQPETGIDALEAANAILAELYAYRKTLAATRSSVTGIVSPTLVVGLISGGINTNVVPDNVKFRIDRRIVPDENPAEAERALCAVIADAAKRWPGVRVDARRVLLAEPFVPRPGQERLVEAIARNARTVFGVDVEPHGVPLYTDARHYSAAGIPTVLYGAGPRTLEEAKGHRADENLVLTDLYAATEVVALSLVDLLQGAR